MSRLKLPVLFSLCGLFAACMPVTDPLVAGRTDNAIMRFSAVEIVATSKLPKQ